MPVRDSRNKYIFMKVVSRLFCVGMVRWQVPYLNKLDLSKQHEDSGLSAGARTELRGIRDFLRKVGNDF